MRKSHPPFLGLLPRYSNEFSNQDFATKAHNVDLRNGDLRPWLEPKELATGNFDNAYYCGCNILELDSCEMVTEMKGNCGYKILSGSEQATLVCDPCAEDQPLSMIYSDEPPDVTVTNPPNVGNSDSTKKKTAVRQYAYSYVDCHNRESLLSLKSEEVSVIDGSQIIVSGFKVPNPEDGIVEINIYRSATGYRSGSEEAVQDATVMLYVGTVYSANDALIDNTPDKNLGSPCTCEENYPADPRLQKVKLYEPTNQLVGYFGNEVHFSSGNSSHIWPIEYKYSFRKEGDLIRNILPVDHGVYVFTNHTTYLISNITCEPKVMYQVNEIDVPKYVGVNDATCIDTRMGPIYNSVEGMILLNGNQYINLTASWFTENDWRENFPDSIRLGFYKGYLFITSDEKTYLLYLDSNNGPIAGRELTTITEIPNRYIKSPFGELIMLTDQGAYQWDSGDIYRELEWEVEYTDVSRTTYSRFLIKAEGLPEVRINDNQIQFAGNNQISTVRNRSKSRENKLSIKSTRKVTSLLAASSLQEIR